MQSFKPDFIQLPGSHHTVHRDPGENWCWNKSATLPLPTGFALGATAIPTAPVQLDIHPGDTSQRPASCEEPLPLAPQPLKTESRAFNPAAITHRMGPELNRCSRSSNCTLPDNLRRGFGGRLVIRLTQLNC